MKKLHFTTSSSSSSLVREARITTALAIIVAMVILGNLVPYPAMATVSSDRASPGSRPTPSSKAIPSFSRPSAPTSRATPSISKPKPSRKATPSLSRPSPSGKPTPSISKPSPSISQPSPSTSKPKPSPTSRPSPSISKPKPNPTSSPSPSIGKPKPNPTSSPSPSIGKPKPNPTTSPSPSISKPKPNPTSSPSPSTSQPSPSTSKPKPSPTSRPSPSVRKPGPARGSRPGPSSGGNINGSSGFCSRAVYNKPCASNIPTVDDLALGRYMGTWYEVGATASYKFRREPGLMCSQAEYAMAPTSSGSGVTISTTSRGMAAVGPESMQRMFQISVASRDACSAARQLCSSILTSSNISVVTSSLNNVKMLALSLSSMYPTEASNITHIVDAMRSALQSVSSNVDDVSNWIQQVQKLNGELSKGPTNVNVVRYLKNNLRFLTNQHFVALASFTSMQASNKGISTTATSLLSHANIASTASQILRESDVMNEGLRGMNRLLEEMGRALEVARGALLTLSRDTSISSKELTTVKGQAFYAQNSSSSSSSSSPSSSSTGKLVSTVDGFQEPYWVVAVEDGGGNKGSYSAALVYSCSLAQPKGELSESLLILSRSPQLAQATTDRFLSLAKTYGIYMECENPFLFTTQDDTNCAPRQPLT